MIGRETPSRGSGRGGSASVPGIRSSSVDALLRETLASLGADALTIAVRTGGEERLLVCMHDGEVREADGSVSLGLVSGGSNRLSGGVGLLQAVEARSLLGFTPGCYLGAPFVRTRHGATGAIAAWSRRPRSWTVPEGTILRRLAAHCESVLEAVSTAAQ